MSPVLTLITIPISHYCERARWALEYAGVPYRAARLDDGRPFLTGEELTGADLTFACMAAPVTAPTPYGTPLPTPDELPQNARALLEEFRAHPAGVFALEVFAEHRPAPKHTG